MPQTEPPIESTDIAVTGMGAVSAYGAGVDKLWSSLLAGRTAVTELSDPALRALCPGAGQVTDFDPGAFMPRKWVNDTARFSQLALAAAMEALVDAGLSADAGQHLHHDGPPQRIGVFIGTGFGGVAAMDAGAATLAQKPDARVGPRLVSKSVPNAAAGTLAIYYGIAGPVLTYTTACASAANALGEALLWLRSGRIDFALAGGTDSLLTPSILAGLRDSGAVATHGSGDVSTWSRPFDRSRQGMLPAEGAAVFVLEPLHRAARRGARVRSLLAGYGTSNDAYHQIAPHPEGMGAVLAIEGALADAGLTPADIDYINAHATATKAGDDVEAKALWQVFGERLAEIPVSSVKGHIGHAFGGAGALEAVACIRALETGWLPPTLNCDDLDEGMPPDVVPHQARQQPIDTALSTSFGFGGQNGALVFRKGAVSAASGSSTASE